MSSKEYFLSGGDEPYSTLAASFSMACSRGDLNKIKNFLSLNDTKIPALFNKNFNLAEIIKLNDPIDIAITRRHFEVVKCLLQDTSIKKNLTEQHHYKYFKSICQKADIPTIEFLLFDKNFNLLIPFENAYKFAIVAAVELGNINMLEHFRDFPNRIQSTNQIEQENLDILYTACKHNHPSIIEYVINYPKINNYKLEKPQLDYCFLDAYYNRSMDVINFFIFNLNFSLSSETKIDLYRHFEGYPNEKKIIKGWIESRDLAISLNQDLHISDDKKKKNKI